MINIRKLAAVDMLWLGARIVLAEYALGIVLPVGLGLISIRAGLLSAHPSAWKAAVGFWLASIAANYVALFIYAISIARGGTVEQEGRPELARAKRYGVQQTIILVPFLVVIMAIMQESQRRQS